ncbi:hypothetical protein O181_112565 [Austropuccinia psidii MF-1]|uniref:Uncharacterized protein n=1 Tax=Austropuccinia psidii MF-1 TaxID=1389203 RepID=A0A9Q3K0R1_9BASI|nr:hypothetical protein [Austropuccinia psidii MF-1]
MVNQFFTITGDNAANKSAIVTSIEHKFNGLNIPWPTSSRYYRCACHVINLVAKDFLSHMGQLSNEDYEFFDDYLAVHHAPIEDSDDDEPTTGRENM